MFAALRHSGQFQFLVATVAVLVAFYTWGGNPRITSKDEPGEPITGKEGEMIFTAGQLKRFDGSDESTGIYIAILGRVYDVQKGRRHYGPDGSYSFFAGRDASTAFITGDFTTISDDLDDVLKLPQRDILAVYNWQKFYEKDYTYVGKLIGRYYDGNGQEKQYMDLVREEIRKEEENNERLELEKALFPPCNTEWSAEKGSTFWCSNKSGGVERDWVGVPRKIYKAGDSNFNCVCVHPSKLQEGNLKEFEDCDPESIRCTFQLVDVK